MNQPQVIKKAILSEKAYKQMEKGTYTFLVDGYSTKKGIAKLIEKQFGVNVKKVNVSTFASKPKRITGTRKFTLTASGKKAIVTLVPGQSIPLLSPKKHPPAGGKKSKELKKGKENQ